LAYFTPGDVSDDNTTYTISVAQVGADADITLTGSDASTDTVVLAAGTNLTLTVAGDDITMDVDDDLSNYNNTTTAFISNITAEAIGSLSDVDVSAVANGSVLSYNSGTGNWEAGDPAVVALNDLSDVDEASPSPGDLLHYEVGTGWTGTTELSASLYMPGIRLRSTLQNDFNTFGTLTGNDGDTIAHTGNLGGGPNFYHPDTDHNFVANFEECSLNPNTFGRFTIMINNETEFRSSICTDILINGFAPNLQWVNGEAPVKGTPGEVDIIEVTVLNLGGNALSNLTEPSINADVYVWAHHLTQDVKLDGDLTGSVFGDDSTLLVDGVNNTIPAANITGAMPAIDGSALTGIVASTAAWGDITGTPTTIAGYGITDGLTNLTDDTTPQLGGNLDLNSFAINGTGSITVEGDITVDTNQNLVIKGTVGGTGQTFGSIVASNGTTDYNQVVFKTGPDSYTDNGEVNWITRVQGTDTTIFEIKGSTLGKSGMTINPDSNTEIDFNISGATDSLLVFVDAGVDKVGIGKIPSQGILDVDGDVYADNLNGTVVATFNLGASGTDHYVFSDSDNHWFPTSENDPTLYLRRGETYVFNNTSGAHPFQIQSVAGAGGAAYSTGVTNNNTVGVVTFKVPMSAPATLYYQCTSHANMGGTMNII
jgi:hypothetical protein